MKTNIVFDISIPIPCQASSAKWTVLAHFESQPCGQNFQAQT